MKSMSKVGVLLLTLTIAFCGVQAVAQSQKELVYTVVEEEPEFPGGSAALSQYLAQNIKFPSALMRKNYNTGPVAAKFIIDKAGEVHDVRITTKPLPKEMRKGMQEFMTAIIAAVEKMPRWRPGQVNGQSVSVFYTLPIEVNMQ
jgi:protein TonB